MQIWCSKICFKIEGLGNKIENKKYFSIENRIPNFHQKFNFTFPSKIQFQNAIFNPKLFIPISFNISDQLLFYKIKIKNDFLWLIQFF